MTSLFVINKDIIENRALLGNPWDKSMYRKIQICDIYIVIILVLYDGNQVMT